MDKKVISLEERVARLEGKVGWWEERFYFAPKMYASSTLMLALALALSVLGLGFPNHYYQPIFGALVVALGYHRNWFAWPKRGLGWFIALLNTLVLSMLFKLLIGAGQVRPFGWVRSPNVQSGADEASNSFLKLFPNLEINWGDNVVSTWQLDLTVFQTFLLLITLFGALFEFQPFVSLVALLLILVSIPSLISFDWTWIFPAVIATGIALYLQSRDVNDPPPAG